MVECCHRYEDSALVPNSGHVGFRLFPSEGEAVRSLAAHLADEHGVMVVRELVVTDVQWCDRCPTRTPHGPMGCAHCEHTGEVRTDRTVAVDTHTVEPSR